MTRLEGLMILSALKLYPSKRESAKYLNLSLETQDKYLYMLEAELGEKLVISNSRGSYLTKQGELIAQNAELLKKCLEEIYAIKSEASAAKNEVKIAHDVNICGNLHIKVLDILLRKYPDIRVSIENCSGAPDIIKTSYDISLSGEMPKEKDLELIAAREIPCKFFASQAYLKKYSYPQNLEDLISNHRLIMRKDNWASLSVKNKWQNNHKCKVSFINNVLLLRDMALHNAAICLIPYYQGKNEKNLISLDNLDCKAVNPLYLVSPKSRKNMPNVQLILNHYKKMINKL